MPAGLGVFATTVILLTVPTAKAAVLGAFLTYRAIYFVLPLVIAVIGFLRRESRG